MKKIPVIKKELLSLFKGQSGRINLIFAVGFGVIAIPSGFLLSFITMPFILGMSAYSSLAADEMSGWLGFVTASPVGRKRYVNEKYISTVISTMIGLLYSILLAALHCAFSDKDFGSIAAFVIPMSLLFGLIIPSLCFPLSFKMGVEKAKAINGGLGLLFGVGMSAMLSLSSDMTAAGLATKFADIDPVMVSLAVGGTGIVIMILSWLLSSALYRTREL